MDKHSLQELVQKFHSIELELSDSGGEITPVLEKELVTLASKMSSELDKIVFVKERSKLTAAYYRQKAREYQKLAQSFEAVDEKLTEYVKFTMINNKVDKVDGDEVVFKLSKRGHSVTIISAELIPDELCEIIRQPDKAAIKEMLTAGHEVGGCELKETIALLISPKRKELK